MVGEQGLCGAASGPQSGPLAGFFALIAMVGQGADRGSEEPPHGRQTSPFERPAGQHPIAPMTLSLDRRTLQGEGGTQAGTGIPVSAAVNWSR